MATTVTVYDRTTAGGLAGELTLEFLTEPISVGELIRARVYQEVREFNARQPTRFQGPVQPSEAELSLNGNRARHKSLVDWQRQYERALNAFAGNRFIIHLGSGHVLMEPTGQYLCIVPHRATDNLGGSHFFLHCDDDPVLSLILGKALLLAEDRQITDPTITRQIRLD